LEITEVELKCSRDPPWKRGQRDEMGRRARVPGEREAGGNKPERHEWKMRDIMSVKDAHGAPYASGRERDRKRTARVGQRRCGERAPCPQQHAARKIFAQMIHLANQGDPGTKDDRADTRAKVGKDRPARASEPGAAAIGADDAGNQNCETQQPCKFRPMGSDESEERGRDQNAADDGHDHRDVDLGSEWWKRTADGGEDRRRDHAIGLPSRKVSFKTLAIGSVEHRRASPAGGVERVMAARPRQQAGVELADIAAYSRTPTSTLRAKTLHLRWVETSRRSACRVSPSKEEHTVKTAFPTGFQPEC
jgi:hypothetical protein